MSDRIGQLPRAEEMSLAQNETGGIAGSDVEKSGSAAPHHALTGRTAPSGSNERGRTSRQWKRPPPLCPAAAPPPEPQPAKAPAAMPPIPRFSTPARADADRGKKKIADHAETACGVAFDVYAHDRGADRVRNRLGEGGGVASRVGGGPGRRYAGSAADRGRTYAIPSKLASRPIGAADGEISSGLCRRAPRSYITTGSTGRKRH